MSSTLFKSYLNNETLDASAPPAYCLKKNLLHCWKLSSVSGANRDSDINNRKNSGAAEARWLTSRWPKMAHLSLPSPRRPLITRCVPLRDVSPHEAASTKRLPNRCASSPPDDQPNFSAYRPRKISLCTWFVYTYHQYHQYSIELAYCTLAPACRFSRIRVPACSRYTSSWDRAARSTC